MTTHNEAAARAQLSAEHERYMRIALEEAQLARVMDEVPVGAVLVQGERVLFRAHNLVETQHNPCAHAEMLCLTEGVRNCGGFLSDCTLYVTLEPCVMCAGTALTARLGKLVFGAFDKRAGCCGSMLDVTDHCFYHSIPVWGGILEAECAGLLSGFFTDKRGNIVQNACKQEATS